MYGFNISWHMRGCIKGLEQNWSNSSFQNFSDKKTVFLLSSSTYFCILLHIQHKIKKKYCVSFTFKNICLKYYFWLVGLILHWNIWGKTRPTWVRPFSYTDSYYDFQQELHNFFGAKLVQLSNLILIRRFGLR